MRKSLIFIIIGCLCSTIALANRIPRAVMQRPPAPQLLEPGDNVVAARDGEVRFRWKAVEFGGESYSYDFRLYRGSELTAKTLLLTKKLSTRETELSLKASMFEEKAQYAWALRVRGPSKGRESYSLFKVAFKK